MIMAKQVKVQTVSELVINQMNAATYFEEKAAGRLKDSEVYVVEPEKQGASAEAFYQWLKERNYDMDNFRGLEKIFPVVTLQAIKIDSIEDGATEMTGTAPPNVKIMFNGKTAISDSDGLWRLPAVPDPNAAEVTIQWVDYAGRTHTEKIPVIFKKYCIPNGIQIVTQSIAEKYELNKPENLEFPASVTQIEERALYNYARITGAAAPNCEYVGTKAFCGCSQLKSVSLPACTTLANDVFFQCSNLREISLPECTKIASWAFHGLLQSLFLNVLTWITSYLMSANPCERLFCPKIGCRLEVLKFLQRQPCTMRIELKKSTGIPCHGSVYISTF